MARVYLKLCSAFQKGESFGVKKNSFHENLGDVMKFSMMKSVL